MGKPHICIPHICIVGTGIAGLRCAQVLIEQDVRVTMLEARHRIGGRICESDELGYPVDLGPQWIHTSGHNPLLKLANETNTPLHTWNGVSRIYHENGAIVDQDTADRFSDLVWRIVDEGVEFSEKNGDKIPKTQSLYDYFVKRAKEIFPDQLANQKLLLSMSQMWGAYIGHPVDKQSLRFAWMEKCCTGDEVIVATTFGAILQKVAAAALSSAEIQFNSRVIGIQAPHAARAENRRVVLLTDDGRTQSFDEVILTTPLGWLKRNKDAFSPSIPLRLSQAIDNISIGQLEKVYITFPTAFWLDPSPTSAASFPGYTHFLAPRYSPHTNPSCWPQEAYNLAAFPPPNRHPTLLFYLYGDCARDLVALASSSSPAATHPLYAFFRPHIALLPHYSADDPACIPTAMLSTAWQLDDLAGNGSYVNFQVPIADAAGDVRCLREGMGPERKVWLAGEHTSPFEECGTATGAYLAGEEVARRVLERCGEGGVGEG